MLTFLAIVIPTVADELPIINNPPAQQEAGKTADGKENSKTQNQNPAPSFTVANPTPSPPLHENGDNKSHQYTKEQKSSWWDFSLTDTLLAIFTLALVIVGLFQFFILRGTLKATEKAANAAEVAAQVAKDQSIDMKASIVIANETANAAKKSAEAAEKSADALPAMERAYIFVEVRRKNPKARLTINFNNFCEIVIKNYGKTPAIVRYIERFVTVLYGITPEIEIKRTGIMPRIEKIIVSGGEEIIDVDTTSISEEKWNDIANNPNARLLCYGLIEYEDVFGKYHDTGWCWWLELITTKDFHFLDHPNNYYT